MIIASVNAGHNASLALMEDDKLIVFIENERLNNLKHSDTVFQAISLLPKYVDHVDHFIVNALTPAVGLATYRKEPAYVAQLIGLNKTFAADKFQFYNWWHNHHQMHAATAFYNSGFKDALCIVKDGAGSHVIFDENNPIEPQGYGIENSTAFLFSYPNVTTLVEKHIYYPEIYENTKHWIKNNVYVSSNFSEGSAFEAVCEDFGFGALEAGKVMGMSSYGKDDPNIPDMYVDKGLINPKVFKFSVNPETDSRWPQLVYKVPKDFQSRANFAWKLQSQVQEQVAKYVLEMLKRTGQKNLCLSGGFFLNCVSNYHLLKNLPADVQIYVEPISSDAGNALGAAKFLYHTLTNDTTIRPQTNIYYGLEHNIKLSDLKDEKIIENVTPTDVAKLLADKKIVALYQGRSEAGPRALGNRSILYDPRDPNGKDHVNTVKKREWFRPFAGTVLLEKAREWFDLRSLTESKFMMFAVDVGPDKQALIPAITHVDGTCRMQTLKREDNPNYYDLIQEFDKLTGVPILFNTSFNLAGNTIVETLKDALWTIHNSAIDYLYLPELKVLVTKAP